MATGYALAEVEGTVMGRDPWVRSGPVNLAFCNWSLAIERSRPYPRCMDPHAADVLGHLIRVLEGDTEALAKLTVLGNDELFKAWRAHSRPELVLDREGVVAVLNGMLDRRVTSGSARDWAFFVRQGHIGSWADGPIFNDPSDGVDPAKRVWTEVLPIDWSPAFEDPINEATSRLDQIGDIVDGVVTDDEIRTLLQTLT